MRIVFAGTGEFGIPCLEALVASDDHFVLSVITQPDRPAGRAQKLLASPIKECALRHQLTVFQPEDVNSATSLSQIRYQKPDLMVVVAYGQILKKPILELPELGCWNVHGSLLPKYRGASPIAAAVRDLQKRTGVTIMQMNEGLDTGDILGKVATRIRPGETTGLLHDRLAKKAGPLLLYLLERVKKGKLKSARQNSQEASLAPRMKKEDGKIDWAKNPEEIDAHIRAMQPWPGAYAWVPDGTDQKMLKIFSVILSKRAKGKPGEIVEINSHGILVAAKKGGVLLREVQLEGRKRMSAVEYSRGAGIVAGLQLA
ncbi:Fmt Methionyl-tRNA formyltransferase [Candidatus Methylacidiphilaceae bacterium]|nr:methionyl-tRNA formyltransferase [Candidatus Paceibacterota bacterium]